VAAHYPGKGKLIKRIKDKQNGEETNQTFQLHKKINLSPPTFFKRQEGGGFFRSGQRYAFEGEFWPVFRAILWGF